MKKFRANGTLPQRISQFKRASGIPAYVLAHRAGFPSPSALSSVVYGAVAVRSDNPRVSKLLDIIGGSFEELFEAEHEAQLQSIA